jgi:hypothetical protein
MKNEFFTVIPQNMREYQMSIREADNENDIFREAFEAAMVEDPVKVEDQLFAFDFFRYGWEAAVRLLNDDDQKATAAAQQPSVPVIATGALNIQRYNAWGCMDGGGPAELESDPDGDLVKYSDIEHLLARPVVPEFKQTAASMLANGGALIEISKPDGSGMVQAYDKELTESIIGYQEQSIANLAAMYTQACAERDAKTVELSDDDIKGAMGDHRVSFFQDMLRVESEEQMISFIRHLLKSKCVSLMAFKDAPMTSVADELPHKATMVLVTNGDDYALAYQRYDFGETVWYDAHDESDNDVPLSFTPTHWVDVPRAASGSPSPLNQE